MNSKSDNIKIMINNEADEVIAKIFDSLENGYQNNLQSMRGSEFSSIIFSCCIINVIK